MRNETNKSGIASISEWFLNPAAEKADGVPQSPSVVEGTLHLDGSGSIRQGRDDDETAIIRTSTSEEPDEPNFLDWRMNPKTSLADWTIVISTPGRNIKYYHVHRNIIMLPSRYFRKLFKKQRKTGGRSDFHLPDEAADVFPELLDYMYRLGHDNVTRDNAVPLYYLSRIFSVERLRWETRKFWESDMALGTIAYYYKAAILFEEGPLMEQVLGACAAEEILSKLDCDAEILKNENPRMLLHLVAVADSDHHENLSKLIAKYCTLHHGQIETKTFTELTKPLTVISLQAACTLLIQECYHAKPRGVTLLQKNCIETLSGNWSQLEVTSEMFSRMLSMQSPEFLAELFQKTTLAAQGRSETEDAAPEINVTPTFLQDDIPDVETVPTSPRGNISVPGAFSTSMDPILSARTEDETSVYKAQDV